MKKIILFFVVLILANAANAQQPKIKITLSNGTTSEYNLADIAQIRFSQDSTSEMMSIFYTDSTNALTAVYPVGEIDSIRTNSAQLTVYSGSEWRTYDATQIDSITFSESLGFIYADIADPRIATVNDSGNIITYYGIKDTAGIPTALSGYTVESTGNPSTKITVSIDSAQRVSNILLASGAIFNLAYSIPDSVIVTFRDSLGRMAIDTVYGPHRMAPNRKNPSSLSSIKKPLSDPNAISVLVQAIHSKGQTTPVNDASVTITFTNGIGYSYDVQAHPDGNGLYSSQSSSSDLSSEEIKAMIDNSRPGQILGSLKTLLGFLSPPGEPSAAEVIGASCAGMLFLTGQLELLEGCEEISATVAVGEFASGIFDAIESMDEEFVEPSAIIVNSYSLKYGEKSSMQLPLSGLPLPVPITYEDCDYSLSAPGQPIPSNGGSGTIGVTCGDNCSVVALSSDDSWLQITSLPTKPGSGTVVFSALANIETIQRTASITIGDQIFTITQDGSPSVSQFNGSYSGTWSGVYTVPGMGSQNVSGPVAFTVSNGVITCTEPSGSGTVGADGAAKLSGTITGYPGIANFTGNFVVNSSTGKASASGVWTYSDSFGTGSGNWTANR